MIMINNLFSIFDPSNSYYFSIWLPPLIITSLLIRPKKITTNRKIITIKALYLNMEKETTNLIETNFRKSSTNIVSTLFVIIFLLNIVSLFPYELPITAHISISLRLSLVLWVSLMLIAWLKNTKLIIIHLVPRGTPIQLINFIVIVECVRNIVRPITLSVRLTANMVAGHLLIGLLASYSISNRKVLVSTIPIIMLVLLESIVALIQAYVLTTLMTLYHNESI